MGSSISFEKDGNEYYIWKFGEIVGTIIIEGGCYIDKKWIKGTQYVFEGSQTSEYLYSNELEEILNKVKELNKEK